MIWSTTARMSPPQEGITREEVGRSLVHLLEIQYGCLTRPATRFRQGYSFLVRRILIWFPPAIPDRGQERVDGSSSRSISRDRRRFETIAFFHPTTSPDFPIHLPRLHCALAGSSPIFLGEIAAIRLAIRVKTPIERWEIVLLLLIYARNMRFHQQDQIMRTGGNLM